MRAFLAIIFSFFWAAQAAAQPVVDSASADETYLTIYPDNLAMITEVRRIDVPAGASTIRFLGVSDQIIAQTSVLQSFEGVTLESNFDTDLITRGAILNKAVGEVLTIKRTDPATGKAKMQKAKLISASNVNGNILGAVFETEDGIEALECAGLWESVIFNHMPKALNPVPVLSMNVIAEKAGVKEISLSYLTQGIGWQADYRLDVSGDAGEGALTGWLTITNSTSKSFEDAPTAIVAGELNREYGTRADPVRAKSYSSTCWTKGSTKLGTYNDVVLYRMIEMGSFNDRYSENDEIVVTGARMMAENAMAPAPGMLQKREEAKQENFGDYKLYRTPRPITLAAQQTKQISFLNIKDAAYKRLFKYDFRLTDLRRTEHNPPRQTRVEYEIDNSKDGNLGKPLPRGTMRVMTRRTNGQTAYLGESYLNDLAVDLPVEIAVSQSSAVMIVPDAQTLENDGSLAIRLKADVLNALPEDVVVEIKIESEKIRYSDIEGESHGRKLDEILPHYRFTLPAESREGFFIDISVVQRSYFEHQLRRYYDRNGEKRYSDEQGGRELNLKGQAGNDYWLSQIDTAKPKGSVGLNAKVLAIDTVKIQDGLKVTLADEEFVFTNKGDVEMEVLFRYTHDVPLELISSSAPPRDKDLLIWNIVVAAGASETLTVKTKGDHRF